MTKEEVLKLALEALTKCADGEEDVLLTRDALAAIRQALAQPAQEPVIQAVMSRLADLLDEDQFKEIEGMVVNAGYTPPAAQPAQEPVAHVIVIGDMVSVSTGSSGLKDLFELGNGAPLYTTPPQRPADVGEDKKEWVWLTDDDIHEAYLKHHDMDDYARMIQAKLKDKNTP